MKKVYTFLILASLCFLLAACAASRQRFAFSPLINNRTDAVVDITDISRSTTEFPDDAEETAPKYFEVVATSTTAPVTTRKPPAVTESPKEYYTVKFVDIDGYSAISIQNVEEGKSAKEPPMPEKRDDMFFVGWDKDFSNVKGSMIVKAIYQKEWLNVYFYDYDATLLKSQVVFHGDDATPPKVTAPDGYTFRGWSKSYKNVTSDLYIYAKYSEIDQKEYTTLKDAYEFLPIIENSMNLVGKTYYRNIHNGVCTIGTEDYGGNILYGNFCDTLNISGYGFTSFEGIVGLKSKLVDTGDNKYSLVLNIYLDDKLAFRAEIDKADTKKEFALDLKGVSNIKIHLQPYLNGEIYYKDADFIGGIINAVLYEN